MDNNRLLFTSGFLSLGLFATFAYLFVFFFFHSDSVNTFALNKKEYISISLVSTSSTAHKNKKKSKSVVAVYKPKNEISKNVNINDLFSDVWTKKITHTKKVPVTNKNLNAIEKQLSKLTQNKPSDISDKVNVTKELTDTIKQDTISSANEVNEYLAKIHTLVYENFNVPPNSEGYSVKALIVLNALGKLIDFRILTYSGSEALNNEADTIKNRLQNIVFPLSPDNKTTNTIVILTSQKE